MKIKSNICVNSQWPARFLVPEDQEACECPGCKVRVVSKYGYEYILTEREIAKMLADEGPSND
jgi:hypothetical protein